MTTPAEAKTAINKTVSTQIDAAVRDAVAPLNAKIATLNTQVATLTAENTDLKAKLAALQPTPPVVTPVPINPTGLVERTSLNTGYKGVLTDYTGPTTPLAGTVIENKRVTKRITNVNRGVVFKNCLFDIPNDYFSVISDVAGDVQLIDCTFANGLSYQVTGHNFTITRCDMFNVENNILLGNNCVVEDSFLHDLSGVEGVAHYDNIDGSANSRGWRVSGNTIENKYTQTSCIYVGDPRSPGTADGFLIDNILRGGGYTIYGGPGTPGKGIVVRNNVFGRKFWPKGGYWGVVSYWQPANNIWENNRYDDGTLVTP